jgi:hypothetical protein
MRTLHAPARLAAILLIAAMPVACNKKKGNCYCKYVSGDKTHYDLNSLSRSEQQDSCRVLDNNAEGFGGECKLK